MWYIPALDLPRKMPGARDVPAGQTEPFRHSTSRMIGITARMAYSVQEVRNLHAATQVVATLHAGTHVTRVYYLDPKWTAWMETELRVDPSQMLTASLKADNTCLFR